MRVPEKFDLEIPTSNGILVSAALSGAEVWHDKQWQNISTKKDYIKCL